MIHAALLALALLPPQDAEPRNVAIVLYPGVELLDFAGPGEVFAATRSDGRRAFRTYTVAPTRDPLVSQGFVSISPEYDFASCPPPDVVVVPGGSVPSGDPAFTGWIAERAKTAEVTMSVCNGALALGAAGLLDGLEVTTHAGSLRSLMVSVPSARVHANRRFVDSGRVVTTAGVSAGIDGALHVVARLVGEEAARQTARYMEYDWRPEEIAALHREPGRVPEGSEVLLMLDELREHPADAVAAAYRREHPDGPAAADEATLNRAGYVLLGRGRIEEAVRAFRVASELFPSSANAADSLGEGLEVAGDEPGALAASKRVLALLEGVSDAGRRGRLHNAAASRLARLEGRGDELPFACPPCARTCDGVRYLEETACPGCAMPLARAGE